MFNNSLEAALQPFRIILLVTAAWQQLCASRYSEEEGDRFWHIPVNWVEVRGGWNLTQKLLAWRWKELWLGPSLQSECGWVRLPHSSLLPVTYLPQLG